MKTSTQRHLPLRAGPHAKARTSGKVTSAKHTDPRISKPAELSWPDYLILLLQIAAEVEHGLMVQYLYAAYSLGHEKIPPGHHQTVQRWRNSLLTIAREEMGHLLTVQNLLLLLGGPINLNREDYPWDTPFYPFPFRLEPLSLTSLSCYVYAEMPPKVAGTERRYRAFHRELGTINRAVSNLLHGKEGHHVDELYEPILEIISDPKLIPDSAFDANTYAAQACWDEWGKGYGPSTPEPGPRGTPHTTDPLRYSARVIVTQMASRTQAIAALKDLAGQGEALHLGEPSEEPSHFDRFMEIYQEFEEPRDWTPTRPLPVDPTAVEDPNSRPKGTFIESKESRTWANLFNLRYRMLLTYIAHTFRLPRVSDTGQSGARAGVLHRVFGEMYNLKTIAGILVRLPLLTDPKDPRRAGPPFEMPYTTQLPETETDCWRLHRELLANSADLCRQLRAGALPDGEQYLQTLCDLDRQSAAWIDQILAGSGATRRTQA